jgi:hypothetical protein
MIKKAIVFWARLADPDSGAAFSGKTLAESSLCFRSSCEKILIPVRYDYFLHRVEQIVSNYIRFE